MVVTFRVSVPVLSEHSMSIPASASMDAKRDTMACFSAKARDPRAIVEVHTTCMAMGTDAPQHYPKLKRLKIPKSYRRNTAMMNDTKNHDIARKKRENE